MTAQVVADRLLEGERKCQNVVQYQQYHNFEVGKKARSCSHVVGLERQALSR